ncbi:MAG: DUF5719 family protein [Mycobacteriales bacterium]
MRRDAPILVAVVVVAVLLSLFAGSTAAHRATKPVGTAPVVAGTLICPMVNGLPNNTTSTATVSDVGAAMSPALHGSGTVTSTVLAGAKSVTSALRVSPWAAVRSRSGQSEAVAFAVNGTVAASLAADEVIETTTGRYRGLAGGPCLAPATDWWFAGGNGKLGFTDRLILANAATTDADVSVSLWTPTGPDAAPRLAAIRVPARSRVSIGIFAVAPDISTVAMHVHANSGAVTAAVVDRRSSGLQSDGGDLVPPTSPPSRRLVINGFPAGPGTRGLVVTNPGTADASGAVKVVTPSGSFTPSSVQQFVVGAGRTSTIDVTKALNGPSGAVVLSSDHPVFAAGQSITVPGGRRLRPDLVWLAAAGPLTTPAAVAVGHEPDGGDCLLLLSAPQAAGSVRLTTPSGFSRTFNVAAGHSVELNITQFVKSGSGPWSFVLTNTGSGPVYAARELRFHGSHGALVTTEPVTPLPQPIPLPAVRQDPRIAVR